MSRQPFQHSISVFLSYAHGEASATVKLERALTDLGAVTRCYSERLYASPRWPKTLGEAVTGQDALVLVWSQEAAESRHLELEWRTALALGKPVVVYAVDDTALPSALTGLPAIEAGDPAQDAPRIIEQLRSRPGSRDGAADWLLGALERIDTSHSDQAYQTVRGLLTSAATTAVGPISRDSSPSLFAPGAVVGGRYEIRGLLGEGGMGKVWRAFDLKLRVEVALKVLFGADERTRDQLRREVRTARAVVSTNVCRIFDLGEAEGTEFLSMEYVDGVTLARLMAEEGPLAMDRASPLASQMLAGLQAIHDAGLVHRDIKPENLMVTRTGRLVVMDLGLARWRTDDAVFSVSGTPAYLAPEQLRGEAVDGRSDLYAAGVVLAELTCPEGAADLEQRQKVWRGLQRALPEVPETPWAPVLAQAVARDPDERPASAEALARALEKETVKTISDADARPYPGLAAFTEAEAEYFFGREAEVEALWKKLQQQPRLLAVVGPSGAGKSSFLRAGLVATAPEGWAILRTTPGGNPFVALGQRVAEAFPNERGIAAEMVRFSESNVAVDVIGRWAGFADHALLIVDQFEELFTQNRAEVEEEFAELLGRLPVEADVHVVLGMRDDFLYHCHKHTPLSPVFSELTPLGPPTGEGLRRAIVQPALKCGFRFEDDALVDEMVSEVGGERGALPLLAFAAAELWNRRDREQGLLTWKDYEAIGGVAGALAGHAEATLERIGHDRLPLVRELFRNLVTAEWTRAERDRDELLSVFPGDKRGTAAKVLDELIDSRLLVSHEVDTEHEEEEHHRIEIIHESLLETWPRLVRWQTQDADAAQMRDQLHQAAKVWDERGRSEDLLWSGTAFKEFELWRERYPGRLTDTEQAFAKSMVNKNARQRRVRRLAVASAFMAMLLVLAIVGGFWQQSEKARQVANEEALRAEASKLLAIAELRRASDTTEALAFTTASLELFDTEEARLLAVKLVQEAPPAIEAVGNGVRSTRFSPDGKWLAGAGHVAEARVWNAGGGRPNVLPEHEASPQGSLVPFWASNDLLTTGLCCGLAERSHVWSLPEGNHLRTIEFGKPTHWATAPHELVALTEEGPEEAPVLQLRSWELPGGQVKDFGSLARSALGEMPPILAPNGRGLVYEEGTGVYFRTFSPERRPEDGQLLGHHAEQVEGRGDLGINPPRIYTRDASGEIRIWNFSQEVPSLAKKIPPSPGEATRRVPDPTGRWGFHLGTGSGSDARVSALDSWPNAQPLVLKRRGSWQLSNFSFHPKGKWLAVSTGHLSRLTLWPLPDEWPTIVENVSITSLDFTPDGRWLAAGWETNDEIGLRLLPVPPDRDRKIKEIQLPQEWTLLEMAFDPAGKFIFAVGNPGRAYILPVDGSAPRELGSWRNTLLMAAAISPGGRKVATAFGYGQGRRTMKVWDLESNSVKTFELPEGSKTSSIPAASGQVWSLHFASDTTLYEAGDGGVRRWDLRAGTYETVYATENGIGVVMASDGNSEYALIQEHPIGRLTISHGPVKALDLVTGETNTLTAFGSCNVWGCDVTGSVSAVGDLEGILRVGNPWEGMPRLLTGHAGIWLVAISPDRRWIASAGRGDETLRLWPMPDLDKQPLHTLPRDELIAKLKSLTNIRVVRDPDSADGWKVKLDEFPGWQEVPTW